MSNTSISPDVGEWKIFHFNRLLIESETRMVVPHGKHFIGLYFNLGGSHDYKFIDHDQRAIQCGEYNFISVCEGSVHITMPPGACSVLCIEFTLVMLERVRACYPMIDRILKNMDSKTPVVLSHINMIITSEMQASIQCILLNKQDFQGRLKKIIDHSKVIDLLFCSLDNIRVLAAAHLRKSEVEMVVKVHDYLLLHLKGNFSVDQLADIVDMRRRKLEKAFKAVYRKSVHRFFLDEKLKHAALLLRDTNSPVKQIAREVGFHLVTRFSEAFKKCYHFSPGEFRKLGVW